MIKLGKRINKSRSKSMVNSKKIVLHDLINNIIFSIIYQKL